MTKGNQPKMQSAAPAPVPTTKSTSNVWLVTALLALVAAYVATLVTDNKWPNQTVNTSVTEASRYTIFESMQNFVHIC